jgi:stage III sporulation protein AB
MISLKEKRFGGSKMVKIMGCILIFISSVAFGFYYSEGFKKRLFQLNDMEDAVIQLQNEIIFTHEILSDVFMNISNKCSSPLNQVFIKISKDLSLNLVDNVYLAFLNAFNKYKIDLNLKTEDIEIALNLAKSLGECDIEGQKSIFNLTIDKIKKQIVQAEVITKKNVKMYRYLGFAFGTTIIILLI